MYAVVCARVRVRVCAWRAHVVAWVWEFSVLLDRYPRVCGGRWWWCAIDKLRFKDMFCFVLFCCVHLWYVFALGTYVSVYHNDCSNSNQRWWPSFLERKKTQRDRETIKISKTIMEAKSWFTTFWAWMNGWKQGGWKVNM